jgi:hypothetical protein
MGRREFGSGRRRGRGLGEVLVGFCCGGMGKGCIDDFWLSWKLAKYWSVATTF